MDLETNNDDVLLDTRPHQISNKSISDEENIGNEENIPHSDGINYWGSVTHIVRTAVGTGILLLPMEIKNLGYITGTVLLIAVILVYYHILHILLDLNYRLKKHFKLKRLTYALIVDKIFLMAPRPIRICRKPLLFVIYVYYIIPNGESMALIIISGNIQQMAKYQDINLSFTVIITCLAVILTTFCMFRSILKILVPFSSASNLCSFAIAAVIIIYSTIYRLNPINGVHPFAGDLNSGLRSMAIYLNAILSTNIILPVNNAMETPRKMESTFGSLNMSALIITIFYSAFALIPYLNLGDNIQENIIANIPISDLLILSINFVYSLALTVPYVLFFFSCFDVIWSSKLQSYLANSKYKWIVEYGIRLGYNALAYFLAVGVSNLALIATISGVVSILLDVAMMPLLQILLMHALKERNYLITLKNVLLIFFCSVLFILSVNDCINEVARLYAA